MPNFMMSKLMKKKALDRWENEGGKFFDDRTGERSLHRSGKEKEKRTNVINAFIEIYPANAALRAGTALHKNNGNDQ